MRCVRCGGYDGTTMRVNNGPELCSTCFFEGTTRYKEPDWSTLKEQEYALNAEADKMARDIIDAHHPWLALVKFVCVFLRDTPASRGREVWVRAKKISGLTAWLLRSDDDALTGEPFFVLEFSWNIWRRLDYRTKLALVDHALCQCSVGELGNLQVRGFDVQDFQSVVDRHGAWNDELRLMIETSKLKEAAPLFADQSTDETADAAAS